MKFIRMLIQFIDDIFIFFGLISFIVASYLINAILGTYILGVAFFIAAFFAGMAMRNPAVQQIINKWNERR